MVILTKKIQRYGDSFIIRLTAQDRELLHYTGDEDVFELNINKQKGDTNVRKERRKK